MVHYSVIFSQYRGFFLIELMVTLCVLTVGLSGTYTLLAQSAIYAARAHQLHQNLNGIIGTLERIRVHAEPIRHDGTVLCTTSIAVQGYQLRCHTASKEHRGPTKTHMVSLTMGA